MSVRVENLKKIQGEESVLGVNFHVDSGELFCLLGPPGAGKTTILRLIAGLERPDEGHIYIDERIVNEVPPGERDVAMVFEDAALYPHMTAYENIAYPLRLRKTPPQEVDRRVREIADLLRISHILPRRPETFSGGERRRVAIGRALVRHPQVLLLDQPLTDLDAKIREEMVAELKKLQKEVGQTMIYATHDYEEALALADRILVLHEGRAEQLGTPEEVYNQPRTPLVAQLVGSPPMNLLPCKVMRVRNQEILEHAAFRIPIPERFSGRLPDEVLLGVRPEHIAISDPDKGLPGEIDIVQTLGDQQIVDLKLQNGTVIKMVVPIDIQLHIGETIYLRLPWEKLLFFNPQNGNIRIDPMKEASIWSSTKQG